jgi:hypothetical protein
MYLFCNSRTHVITLYSGHVCVYYASTLRCWHLVWILVRTDHPCLGVGCHTDPYSSLTPAKLVAFSIGPARVSSDDGDKAQVDDDEETEDDE